jgi:class 3 adenylate cyclase
VAEKSWLHTLGAALGAIAADMARASQAASVHDAFGGEAWLRNHAPKRINELYATHGLIDLIKTGRELPLIILAVDIRKSTMLMKEAISAKEHATTLNKFIAKCSETVRANDGWFDKFMGDGFLAYWVIAEGYADAALTRALWTAKDIMEYFEKESNGAFLRNSKNWPDGVGLSAGLDAGSASLVMMADEPTIVGAPVVGAVRMVSCAKPGEVLANVQLLRMIGQKGKEFGVKAKGAKRPTKEYKSQYTFVLEYATKPVFQPWPRPAPSANPAAAQTAIN